MSGKAVFLDRDKTLIEDPGYISDPRDVKLLPGAEQAIRALHQAGFKVVVVTNQSGVARGLITVETLDEIHAELRRQLRAKDVHLDGLYYCPYHPDGTVEQFAAESELRKPRPGMLLQAASEMDLDLTSSWMVGDSARDIEAGIRAGCRTVRIRTRPATEEPRDDASIQADFAVRNLVDAARVILREGSACPAKPARAPAAPPATRAPDTQAPTRQPPATPSAPESPEPHADVQARDEAKAESRVEGGEGASAGGEAPGILNDSIVRQEILRHVRQIANDSSVGEFSFAKLMGGVVQMLSVLSLLLTLVRMIQDQLQAALVWGVLTVALQMMALTFFTVRRAK
jgi:D,D-heptose 1,7-bisphosphate phosphatase